MWCQGFMAPITVVTKQKRPVLLKSVDFYSGVVAQWYCCIASKSFKQLWTLESNPNAMLHSQCVLLCFIYARLGKCECLCKRKTFQQKCHPGKGSLPRIGPWYPPRRSAKASICSVLGNEYIYIYVCIFSHSQSHLLTMWFTIISLGH